MVSCRELHDILRRSDLSYFTGVPDSTLKSWMSYLSRSPLDLIHRPAANERAAIAHAAGYYLATGKVPVVYLQNSGLGNCVNPLMSLADRSVYGIPMILMVGWRGEPGLKDEPQHIKMGRVQLPLFEVLEIRYEILVDHTLDAQIAKMTRLALEDSSPVALVVKEGLLEPDKEESPGPQGLLMTREEAIHAIVDSLDGSEMVVSSTGKMSRELFEYRVLKQQDNERDFYMVGSMGHASSVAVEVALQAPEKRVYVLDGDGALIMHMGALATIGALAPRNLVHVVLDNGCHESTGGQATVSEMIDIARVARACGYRRARTLRIRTNLVDEIRQPGDGPIMLVVKVATGSRKDLGRPTTTPRENKRAFMRKLSSHE